MLYKIYVFLGNNDENVIAAWALGLQKKEKAKINFKVDMLAQKGEELFPSILTPTVEPNIKEIVINGRIALRLMICRGPLNMDGSEFTLLLGSQEKDKKYIPRNAPGKAEEHRQIIIRNPNRRVIHERIK